ncbi:O-antigen ligase family protein [Zobellia nedashkovskayae]
MVFQKGKCSISVNFFFVGCLLHVIYLQYNFIQLELFNSLDQISFYNMPFREAVLLLKFEALHPTYISLWYCFAICIAFYHFKISNSIIYRVIIVLAITLFLFTIVLLSSRIAILSLGFLSIFWLIRMKKTNQKLIFSIALLGVIAFGLTKVKFISSRLIDEFKQTELAPPIGKRHNSINIRVGIYQCAADLIRKNSIWGVGIGDVQDQLNRCYSRYDTDVYQLDEYNSHGYFLHVYLVGGLIAFFCSTLYVLCFYWNCNK